MQRVDLKPFCIEIETGDRLIYIAMRTDDDVYGWMDDIYSRSPRLGVSQPTNFVHQVHVGFDPKSGGFTVSHPLPLGDQTHTFLSSGASYPMVQAFDFIRHHKRGGGQKSRGST